MFKHFRYGLRHPFSDHGVKKLLTGKTILLLVDAQLRKMNSLGEIAENLRAKMALQKLTQMESVHGSSIHRKLEKLPLDILQEICLSIFDEIHETHRKKNGVGNLGRLHIGYSAFNSSPLIN